MPVSQPIRSLLADIGLDARATEVYLAILALKSARVTGIAKEAKQSRSHTYLILRELRDMGLVSEVEQGKIIYFTAEPPNSLLSHLHDREDEINRLKVMTERALPLLSELTAVPDQKPRVTFLTGLEGMKKVYRDALTEQFVAFFNPDAMYQHFEENVFLKIFGRDIYLRGRDLIVSGNNASRYIQEMKEHDEYEIRVLPEGIDFATDTLVYGDTICMFSYDEEYTIIRIENRNLAESFRSWHTMMWNLSQNQSDGVPKQVIV